MNVHTKPQIITTDGKPAFAVIPWDEYLHLVNSSEKNVDSDILFPNDVVKANARGASLIKAWREHFNLTQKELSEKAGMIQSALARLENNNKTPRRSTLQKIADALGINVEQLME